VAKRSDLEFAFDAAIAQTQKCIETGLVTARGEEARGRLEKLEEELKRERERAAHLGAIDHEWFRQTIRSLVEWLPETELTLIAALGRIVRANPAPGV